jgi:hypothetical protein
VGGRSGVARGAGPRQGRRLQVRAAVCTCGSCDDVTSCLVCSIERTVDAPPTAAHQTTVLPHLPLPLLTHPNHPRLEEFLPSVPDKELSRAWEAISSRLPPLIGTVTSAAGAYAIVDCGVWYGGTGCVCQTDRWVFCVNEDVGKGSPRGFHPTRPNRTRSPPAAHNANTNLHLHAGDDEEEEEEEEGEEGPRPSREEACEAFRVLQAVVTLAQGTLNVRTCVDFCFVCVPYMLYMYVCPCVGGWVGGEVCREVGRGSAQGNSLHDSRFAHNPTTHTHTHPHPHTLANY